MKFFKTALILAMLVLFPLISWYYLTGGIDYRKQSLEELKNRTDLPESIVKLYPTDMEDQVSLIKLGGTTASLEQLAEQFGKVPQFRSIDLSEPKDSLEVVAKNSLADYAGKVYLLVDDSMHLRHTYSEGNEDMKLLVKHIATLLPFDIKKKEKEDDK